MELITRPLLNKLINEQFELNRELSKEKIFKLYGIKPYKREGKTWLYKLKDVKSIGINYEMDIDGFYPISHFEEKFWINKDGIIRNINNNTTVKTYIGTDLYEHVILRYYGKKYRKRVHSIMGNVFLGNPEVVNHKDTIKSNNKLYNLERSTHKENIKHAYDKNVYTSRGGKGTPILVYDSETKEELEFPSMRKAEEYTGVDRHRIKNIINKKNTNNTKWVFNFK